MLKKIKTLIRLYRMIRDTMIVQYVAYGCCDMIAMYNKNVISVEEAEDLIKRDMEDTDDRILVCHKKQYELVFPDFV